MERRPKPRPSPLTPAPVPAPLSVPPPSAPQQSQHQSEAAGVTPGGAHQSKDGPIAATASSQLRMRRRYQHRHQPHRRLPIDGVNQHTDADAGAAEDADAAIDVKALSSSLSYRAPLPEGGGEVLGGRPGGHDRWTDAVTRERIAHLRVQHGNPPVAPVTVGADGDDVEREKNEEAVEALRGSLNVYRAALEEASVRHRRDRNDGVNVDAKEVSRGRCNVASILYTLGNLYHYRLTTNEADVKFDDENQPQGTVGEAMRCYDEALDLYRQLDDTDGDCGHDDANGRNGPARDEEEDAGVANDVRNVPLRLLQTQYHKAILHKFLRQYEQAASCLEEVLSLSQRERQLLRSSDVGQTMETLDDEGELMTTGGAMRALPSPTSVTAAIGSGGSSANKAAGRVKSFFSRDRIDKDDVVLKRGCTEEVCPLHLAIMRTMASAHNELGSINVLIARRAARTARTTTNNDVEEKDEQQTILIDRAVSSHRRAIDLLREVSNIEVTRHDCPSDTGYDDGSTDDDAAVAATLTSLGHLHCLNGRDYASALRCYEEARSIRRARAASRAAIDLLSSADASMDVATATIRTVSEQVSAANALVHVANVHYQLGVRGVKTATGDDGGGNRSNLDEALTLYQEALCSYREGEESLRSFDLGGRGAGSPGEDKVGTPADAVRVQVAGALYNIGCVHMHLDRRDDAKRVFEECLLVRTSVLAMDHVDVGRVWHALGNLMLREYNELARQTHRWQQHRHNNRRSSNKNKKALAQTRLNAAECFDACLRVYRSDRNMLGHDHPLERSAVRGALQVQEAAASAGEIVTASSASGGEPIVGSSGDACSLSGITPTQHKGHNTLSGKRVEVEHEINSEDRTIASNKNGVGDRRNGQRQIVHHQGPIGKEMQSSVQQDDVRSEMRIPSPDPLEKAAESVEVLHQSAPRSRIWDEHLSSDSGSGNIGGDGEEKEVPIDEPHHRGAATPLVAAQTSCDDEQRQHGDEEDLSPEAMDALLGNIQVYVHGEAMSCGRDGEGRFGGAAAKIPEPKPFADIINNGEEKVQQAELKACTERLREQKATLGEHHDVAKTLEQIGHIYIARGEVEKAVLLFNETLRVQRACTSSFGERDLAETLSTLGDLHRQNDDCDVAMKVYGEALLMQQATPESDRTPQTDEDTDMSTSDAILMAQTFNKMGTAQLQVAKFNKAMEYHKEALDTLRGSVVSLASLLKATKFDDESCRRRRAQVSHTLIQMGTVYLRRGIFREMTLQSDLREYESIHDTITMLSHIGNAHDERGEYVMALKYHAKVLQLQKNEFGLKGSADDLACVPKSLNIVGVIHRKKGNLNKALKYHKEATKVLHYHVMHLLPSAANDAFSEREESIAAIRAENLVNMGMAHQRKGQIDLAMQSYEEAMEILKSVTIGEDHPQMAQTLHNMGTVHEEKCNFDAALDCFHDALLIHKEELGDNHPETLGVLISIGKIYSAQGEFDEAMNIFADVLSVQRKVFGLLVGGGDSYDHPTIATTLHNFGVALAKKGDLPGAMKYFKDALRIRRKSLGSDHPDVAMTLNSIGVVYANKGKCDQALQMYYEALSVQKNTLGEDHICVGRTLNNIGIVHSSKGDFAEAMEFYNKALHLTEAAFCSDHPFVADTLINIGNVHLRKHEHQTAITKFNVALSKYRLAGLEDDHPNIIRAVDMVARAKREESLSV